MEGAILALPTVFSQGVLVPGEPEARTRERRQREGIPIPHATWEAVRAVAAELGVDAA